MYWGVDVWECNVGSRTGSLLEESRLRTVLVNLGLRVYWRNRG